MPTTAEISGPFSYSSVTFTESPSNNYDLVANKTKFDPSIGETIEVYLNGVLLAGDGTTGSSVDALAANPSVATFWVDNVTTPTKVHLTTPNDGIASGTVLIKRISNRSTPQVDFAPGSVIREQDLDASTNQTLHVAQEAMDIALQGIVIGADNEWDASTSSINRVIKNVANPVSDNDAVNKTYLEDTWLTATDKTNSATVAGISADVTTVAGVSANVTTVAGVSANVTTVATNIASVNTVATDIAKVIVVADDLSEAISEIETAALDLQEATSEIDTVSNSIANVNTVGTAIANVNTVAGISGNVTTVAGISGNVTTVAGISANTTTVAGISGNVTTVAGNSANVTKVANIDANVTKVADIDANVTTVAGIGTNGADVTTVAGISGNVTTVAGNNANVTTVAGISANVTTVAGNNANVTTVATNINSINDFADKYRIASSAPSSNNDDGDLYYNTGTDQLNVYDGSAWTSIGLTQAQTTVTADNSATAMAIALG